MLKFLALTQKPSVVFIAAAAAVTSVLATVSVKPLRVIDNSVFDLRKFTTPTLGVSTLILATAAVTFVVGKINQTVDIIQNSIPVLAQVIVESSQNISQNAERYVQISEKFFQETSPQIRESCAAVTDLFRSFTPT